MGNHCECVNVKMKLSHRDCLTLDGLAIRICIDKVYITVQCRWMVYVMMELTPRSRQLMLCFDQVPFLGQDEDE